MNTKLSTFRLRNEIRWFLKENFSNVIFIDDMNLNELSNQNKLEIILVDHHYLRSKFNKIVVEIIDHHQIKKDSIILQKYVPKNLKTLISLISSSAIKIEPVGSCCTLIAEKLLSANFQMTEEIAYLLIGKRRNPNQSIVDFVFQDLLFSIRLIFHRMLVKQPIKIERFMRNFKPFFHRRSIIQNYIQI